MTAEISSPIPLTGGDAVIPVSALNRAIGAMLERSFPLAWIAGEISNFTRAASGHWYFSIKDDRAQIRCVMFRGRAQYAQFTPREGDHIEVRAMVTMYEPRGELQLNVEAVRRTGQGRLYEAFLRLKAQLEAEGLFAAERKRVLPPHPRAIADVRAPTPTAAAELVSPQRTVLLRDLDHRRAALARGFGRMMERRAQQLDWLARRLVSPGERIARQRQHLRQLSLRLCSAGVRPVRDAHARLTMVQLRWRRCRPDLERAADRVQRLAQRLHDALHRQHERRRARVAELAARAELLSPRRTLERGYAALIDPHSGSAVRAPDALIPGRRVTVHLARGSADLGIADVQPRLDESF
ncbi:hypothetical protein DFQ30_011190 [Apophysomyces sp. BC1015]|nr:hypothetical protein DFQ30_011190 [Apophysomyces sp. BC1015]